jgi:hypothetical protein
MSNILLRPICVSPDTLIEALYQQGYAVINSIAVCQLAGINRSELDLLTGSWSQLSPDNYLRDGGRYRTRRHSCYVLSDGEVQSVKHRPHWQSEEYNALHGGLLRHFEPIAEATKSANAWNALLKMLAGIADQLKGQKHWYTEAHQFRIDTTDGIGRPTPEGAHRDGVDLVAVFFVGRYGVKGGETRIFEATGPSGCRFTFTEPWSLMILDDHRVIHESTPIQPVIGKSGHRDTLVVTLRSKCFQCDDE